MFKEVATKKKPEIAKNATANVQTEDDNLEQTTESQTPAKNDTTTESTAE